MKKLLSLISLVLILTACGSKGNKTTEAIASNKSIAIDAAQTTVLYFHSNHRCATCMAVENVAKESLNENMPFYSIDITLDENKELVKQYGVAGQTLLIVKGEQKINVTNEAFMYARSQPEKVKAKIQSAIASL